MFWFISFAVLWLLGQVLMCLMLHTDEACKEIPPAFKFMLILLWPGTVIGGIILVTYGAIKERRRG